MTTVPKSDDVPWIISVDDHVVEPPSLFENWLPERYKDRAPKVERRHIRVNDANASGVEYDLDGDSSDPVCDAWYFGGMKPFVPMQMIALHKDQTGTGDTRLAVPITYEDMRPGCYDPKARLDDMTLSHVEASLAFPTFPRFCGQAFTEQTANDRDLGLALVRAYNDWMVDEWAGDSGGRLIPLCVVPLWDPALAAEEIQRNAARGVRAVTFSEVPYHLGLPSIHSGHWDPFFAACNDTGTAVCMHIGSSSKLLETSPDAPKNVQTALTFNGSMASLADYIFSGLLVRYPKLKLAYSEGQIGWIPYMLERMDDVYVNHPWGHGTALPEPPSAYFRRHVWGCFFNDEHGVESIEKIGRENVTFETDYPHADGSFPHTLDVAREQLDPLDAETRELVCRGNAIRLLELDMKPGFGGDTVR